MALEPFLTKPRESLHLAEISRELKQPHPTVRQWLNALEMEGILRKSFKGRLTLYALNTENPLLVDYLVIAEKEKLILKTNEQLLLQELRQFIHEHAEEKDKTILFGSAAEDVKKAGDIDLLTVGSLSSEIFRKFSKKINKEVHVIHVNSLGSVSAALKAEIIKKHLLIEGAEQCIRWMVWQR